MLQNRAGGFDQEAVTVAAVFMRVRTVARIWAVLAVVLLFTFFAGEGLIGGDGSGPTPAEWVGLAFFPGGVVLGHVLAFRREGLGGLISVGSLTAFYAWNLVVRGRLPNGIFFLLFAAPGFMFLYLHHSASSGRP